MPRDGNEEGIPQMRWVPGGKTGPNLIIGLVACGDMACDVQQEVKIRVAFFGWKKASYEL